MGFIQPISTRTEYDLHELEALQQIGYKNFTSRQKEKWIEGMIGALNATDLNRIENNTMILSLMISAMSNKKTYKTDWVMTNFVKMKDFIRIYRNLVDLMYAFGFQDETPKYPYDSIQKLNKVEELLQRSYNIISKGLRRGRFKTSDGEYFKTSDGEYFNVAENTLKRRFKTSDGEYFKTNNGEYFNVFASTL